MIDEPTPAEAAASAAGAKKAQGAVGKKGKKQDKISLAEFLGDTPASSWADEMDSLPSAPSARAEGLGHSGNLGGGFSRQGYGDRTGPSTREDVPLPSAPPYTAFIGNLSWDLTEVDIQEFFGGSSTVESVRIVMDNFENKPKGFGYVEFRTLDDLRRALESSGSSLGSRPIRVTVAEPPRQRGGFVDRGADVSRRMFDDSGRDEGRSLGEWTRSGPLPALERGGPSRLSSGVTAPPNRASFEQRDAGPDVDWSAARGGRFQPSAAPAERLQGVGSSRASSAASTPLERAPDVMSKADNESQWRKTSPVSTPPPTIISSSSPMRRKLELAPRSTSSPSSNEVATSAGSSKPSPFGNAAPVNTAERDRQIEERLASTKTISLNRSTVNKSHVRQSSLRSVADPESGPATPVLHSASGQDNFLGNAKSTDTSKSDKDSDARLDRGDGVSNDPALFPLSAAAPSATLEYDDAASSSRPANSRSLSGEAIAQGTEEFKFAVPSNE